MLHGFGHGAVGDPILLELEQVLALSKTTTIAARLSVTQTGLCTAATHWQQGGDCDL